MNIKNVKRAKEKIDDAIAALENTEERKELWKMILEGCFDPDQAQDQAQCKVEKMSDSLARVNMMVEFKCFFKAREADKVSRYRSVATLGFWVFAFSLPVSVTWNSLSNAAGTYYLPLNIFLMILGAFIRVLGLSIYSIVPTTEFDIFRYVLKPENWYFKICMFSFLALLCIGAPIGFVALSGGGIYYVYYPFIPLGFSVLNNLRPGLSYGTFVVQCEIAIVLFEFSTAVTDCYLAIVDGLGLEYFIASVVYTLAGIIVVVFVLSNRHERSKESSRIGSDTNVQVDTRANAASSWGWGAREVNTCIYIFCAQLGVDFIVIGIGALLSGVAVRNAVSWFITALADVAPLLVVWYLTPTKAFTLIARWYESGIKRRFEDGAFLSALIKLAHVDHQNDVVWQLRKELLAPSTSMDAIDRNLWMKGQLGSRLNGHGQQRQVVKIRYHEDMDPDWIAEFNDTKLVISRRNSQDVTVHKTFEEWVKENFKDKYEFQGSSSQPGALQIDKEELSIWWTLPHAADAHVPLVDNKIEDLKNMQKYLLELANANLREYKWPGRNFDRELLSKSPRFIGDVEEMARVHGLSRPARVVDKNAFIRRKIDFFISHSWADDPEWKIQALTDFSEEFKRKNYRYPTYWFDKVCIDQNNPINGIAALPIYIGACENILVLLGETYTSRLWCIWELFTLFTFCNRELAMERIHIISPNANWKDRIREFKIEDAHCFDPNEEFILRRLMIDVIKTDQSRAVDSLKESLKQLADKHDDGGYLSHLIQIASNSYGSMKRRKDSGLPAVAAASAAQQKPQQVQAKQGLDTKTAESVAQLT